MSPMNLVRLTVTAGLIALLASPVLGQQKPAPSVPESTRAATSSVGFADKNHDGINDRFADADGDGVNDVDGKPYPHRFRFKDKNKDGINDLWIDRDGDGVNDVGRKLKGRATRESDQNVLDMDRDGHNDITGEAYDRARGRWMGAKWGFWNETREKVMGRFVDENSDGIDDRLQGAASLDPRQMHHKSMRDYFIDEDGDGICDGRGDVIRRMGRMQQAKDKGGRHHHP